MRPICPSDPRVKKLAKLCSRVKLGMSTEQAAKKAGYSLALTQALLAHCRKQRLLVLYKIPFGAWVWISQSAYTEILSDAVNARVIRRREYNVSLYRHRRQTGEIDSNNRITDPPDWPIERRIVKADGSPLPFICRAASSVFAWRPAA